MRFFGACGGCAGAGSPSEESIHTPCFVTNESAF